MDGVFVGVASQLTHSAEYFGNIIITPAYEKYLGRAPFAAGIAYRVDPMQIFQLPEVDRRKVRWLRERWRSRFSARHDAHDG